MKTRSQAKRSRHGEDRLSDLPDDVLSNILSLMPIKDAVRTSVLSKDWEYKWTCISKVDVNDRVSYTGQTSEVFFRRKSTRDGFVDFVERLVFFPSNITRFCLAMHSQYNSSRISGWINALLTTKVECLKVSYCQDAYIDVPNGLLHITTLRKLKLHLSCTFLVPSVSLFPNLKILKLCTVKFINQSLIIGREFRSDKLSLAFPVLEKLQLIKCKFVNAKMVEFDTPTLSSLVHGTADLNREYKPADYYSIKILSTKIVRFKYDGEVHHVQENIVFTGQQVTCAELAYMGYTDIESVDKVAMHARAVLSEFSILKELKMSGYFTKAIALTSVRVSLPILHHLARLEVCSQIDPKGLLELLHKAPLLKFLDIFDEQSWYVNTFAYDGVRSVPLCIQHNLEEVNFKGYGGTSDYVDLAAFLVKHTRQLKINYITLI